MEKFLVGLEDEDPPFQLAWKTGISIAKAYLKGGSSKKAVVMLRRTELVVDTKSKDSANKVLMKMYGDAGAKLDESRLYRLIYLNSKKGKRMRAYKSKEGNGGDSYYPIFFYGGGYGGGGCGGGGCGGGD